jgi:hypothetical protein
MSKLSFRFLIWQPGNQSSGGIEIEVMKWEPDGYNGVSSDKLCAMTWLWQTVATRPGDEPLGVFGFNLEIKVKNIYYFEDSVKASRRILKKMDGGRSPLDAIEALLEIGALEVVYDSRESQYIPIGDVKGPEYLDFIDDYRVHNIRSNWSGCKYAVMATSEIEAKAGILAKAAKNKDAEWCEKFVAAGMPVFVPEHSRYPNVTPAIERLEEVGLIKEEANGLD